MEGVGSLEDDRAALRTVKNMVISFVESLIAGTSVIHPIFVFACSEVHFFFGRP